MCWCFLRLAKRINFHLTNLHLMLSSTSEDFFTLECKHTYREKKKELNPGVLSVSSSLPSYRQTISTTVSTNYSP